MTANAGVVIAGGGLAAARTAQALRDTGYEGLITVLSEERELPYDRPPLSKNYLLGKVDDEAIRLVGASDYEEAAVTVRLGAAVTGLDRERRHVVLEGGERVPYDKLVVATGARPVTLGMLADRENVCLLRTADDARRLREALSGRPRVGIVGGGFIGLEIASVARQLGCEVTVVEAATAPLATVIGAELGRHVQTYHERRGVAFRCGAMLVEAVGDPVVSELRLADGTSLEVDLVVVGVGVVANIDWLAESGLEVHRGLVCDAAGRTADPDVLAAGDVVCRHIDGVCHPTGHWTATGDHARAVASVICGTDPGPSVEDHYFWSDQFDARLQFVGVVPQDAEVSYLEGDPAAESFVAVVHAGGEVTAVFAMSNPRRFIKESMPLRRGEKVPAPA